MSIHCPLKSILLSHDHKWCKDSGCPHRQTRYFEIIMLWVLILLCNCHNHCARNFLRWQSNRIFMSLHGKAMNDPLNSLQLLFSDGPKMHTCSQFIILSEDIYKQFIRFKARTCRLFLPKCPTKPYLEIEKKLGFFSHSAAHPTHSAHH